MIASEFSHGQGRSQKDAPLFFARIQFSCDQQFGLAEMIIGRQECPPAGSEQMLVGALQKLLAVVENYPQLKADSNFLQLQKELVNTEDRIQAARRFYNGNVRDYRNKCETFPSAIVAGMFGFETRDFFNVEPAVREVPKIENFNS